MVLVVKFTLHFILPHIFACKSLTGRYCNLQIYSGVHTFHAVCYIFMTDKASEHFTKCKPNQDTHTRTITSWHDTSARHILAITCTFYYRLTGWQLVICMYSIIAPIGVCTHSHMYGYSDSKSDQPSSSLDWFRIGLSSGHKWEHHVCRMDGWDERMSIVTVSSLSKAETEE